MPYFEFHSVKINTRKNPKPEGQNPTRPETRNSEPDPTRKRPKPESLNPTRPETRKI